MTVDAARAGVRAGRISSVLRGRPEDAVWVRPAFIALLVVSGALYTWNLAASGWSNGFYSAAAQAGSVDWTAFFFGSSDAANAITVDKPPLSVWLMALSIRAFGLSPLSILLPQALLGVATVAITYALVRRQFAAPYALAAGAILAVTPVAVLIFRFNNPDALLVFLCVLAVYWTQRGIETGHLRWMLLAGAAIGLAFLSKQLQALLVVPVLAGVFAYASALPWRRRIAHLLAAAGTIVVSAGWWVAIVELVPQQNRPYLGGSQSNSFLELTFGYNGLGRLTGDEVGSVGAAGAEAEHWGDPGPFRLLNSQNADQIAWLLIPAFAVGVFGLFVLRRDARESQRRALLLLSFGSLLITAIAFSAMGGIFHSYYTVALAPFIATTLAMGASLVVPRLASSQHVRFIAAAVVLYIGVWSATLAGGDLVGGLTIPFILVAAGLVTAVGIAKGRQGRLVCSGLAVVVLAGPLAFSIATVNEVHEGVGIEAGPVADLMARDPDFVAQLNSAREGAERVQTPTYIPGGLLGGGDVSPTIVALIEVGADDYTWPAATIYSNNAALYQLESREPVMAIGGFNGTDPSPTPARFEELVEAGEIHYFLAHTDDVSLVAQGGSDYAVRIESWVERYFAPVLIDGVKVYDLSTEGSRGN